MLHQLLYSASRGKEATERRHFIDKGETVSNNSKGSIGEYVTV
jgi:hypothetical protein